MSINDLAVGDSVEVRRIYEGPRVIFRVVVARHAEAAFTAYLEDASHAPLEHMTAELPAPEFEQALAAWLAKVTGAAADTKAKWPPPAETSLPAKPPSSPA